MENDQSSETSSTPISTTETSSNDLTIANLLSAKNILVRQKKQLNELFSQYNKRIKNLRKIVDIQGKIIDTQKETLEIRKSSLETQDRIIQNKEKYIVQLETNKHTLETMLVEAQNFRRKLKHDAMILMAFLFSLGAILGFYLANNLPFK